LQTLNALSATTATTAQPRPAVSAASRTARLAWVAVGVVIVIRTVLALADISRPGLDPDESLFVNAATLRLPGIFIAHTFHGITLMVFPYIGALKSWLYDPIFAVFGISPASIRVPVVLIVSGSLFLL